MLCVLANGQTQYFRAELFSADLLNHSGALRLPGKSGPEPQSCWLFFCLLCNNQQIYHMDVAALPEIQLSLYLCPAMAFVTCVIKTPGSFLRLLPVDVAISSAPVLTGEKSQVSGRQWDRGVNDILSNYLSPLHRLVQGLEETTWDKQLHGKRFWSLRRCSAPLAGLRHSPRVLKW